MTDSEFVDAEEDVKAAEVDEFNFDDVLKEQTKYAFTFLCSTELVAAYHMQPWPMMSMSTPIQPTPEPQ